MTDAEKAWVRHSLVVVYSGECKEHHEVCEKTLLEFKQLDEREAEEATALINAVNALAQGALQ